MFNDTPLENEVISDLTTESSTSTNEYAIEALIPSIDAVIEAREENHAEKKGSDSDSETAPQIAIPEFTENLIGRRTKERFKEGELTFFHYYNSKGTRVACVVRCDFDDDEKPKAFAQYSYNRTDQRWQASWGGDSKPPYNLQEVIARPDKPVMIVEGEKVVEQAKHLFPEFVFTTSCMGAGSANLTNWEFLKGRDVIVAPDNDANGAKYARALNNILPKVEVKSISGFDAKKLGRFLIVDGKPTRRNDAVPNKYDLANSVEDGWTAELIAEWKNHADFSPFFEAASDVQTIRELPKEGEELIYIAGKNYKLDRNSNLLWWEKTETDRRSGDTTSTWMTLSGYIKPTHCTVDINGNHGLLVEIVTRRYQKVDCFFAREEMATEKDTTKLLLSKGLAIPNLRPENCYALNFYLNNFKPESKAIGVDMVGWQDDNSTYILPFADDSRNSYTRIKEGEKPTTYILQQKGISTRFIKRKGTLAEWQRTVGAVCRGNHLHSFAIIAALTPPALKLLNEEGGFFLYAGSTSIGKSTILHVAKSVWGFENLGSFRATDNSLESTCKNSNDGMLFLDEIGEIEPEALDKVIYMLANGATKGRSDRSGNAKATTHFKVLAQCTGEMGLVAKLAEKNKKAKGGQLIRMAELNANRGVGLNTFDVLNINPDTRELFATGREQAEYLKTHANKNCGIVIDSFLKEAVKDIEGFAKDLEEAKDEWIKRKFTGDEGVEVSRMAKRFSTIYASGVMAVAFGVVPFSIKEVEACVNTMFDNWLERFGGDSSYELKTMIDDIHSLCVQQQHSRFCNAHPEQEERINLPREKAGYWKMAPDKNGLMVLSEFWIYLNVFEQEVLKGKDKKVFYPLLVKGGYLIKGDHKHYAQLKRPAKETPQRFIVVSVAALLGESD